MVLVVSITVAVPNLRSSFLSGAERGAGVLSGTGANVKPGARCRRGGGRAKNHGNEGVAIGEVRALRLATLYGNLPPHARADQPRLPARPTVYPRHGQPGGPPH